MHRLQTLQDSKCIAVLRSQTSMKVGGRSGKASASTCPRPSKWCLCRQPSRTTGRYVKWPYRATSCSSFLEFQYYCAATLQWMCFTETETWRMYPLNKMSTVFSRTRVKSSSLHNHSYCCYAAGNASLFRRYGPTQWPTGREQGIGWQSDGQLESGSWAGGRAEQVLHGADVSVCSEVTNRVSTSPFLFLSLPLVPPRRLWVFPPWEEDSLLRASFWGS